MFSRAAYGHLPSRRSGGGASRISFKSLPERHSHSAQHCGKAATDILPIENILFPTHTVRVKRPKMDWDRVHEEDLVRRRGMESVFSGPKPIKAIPWIGDLMNAPDFPQSAVGKKVRTKSFEGKISQILDNGARITITNEMKFSKTFIVELLRVVEKERPRKNKKKKRKKAKKIERST